MSSEVSLDTGAATELAGDVRAIADALTAGGMCLALSLPGDDAGFTEAVHALTDLESAAALTIAAHVEHLASRLDARVQLAVRADTFGPR